MHAAQFICVWLRKENHVALKLHLQHLQLCGRNDMRINRMLGCWVVGLHTCAVDYSTSLAQHMRLDICSGQHFCSLLGITSCQQCCLHCVEACHVLVGFFEPS